ncbi:hypothetical protein P3S68_017708 [Capsicum galapagoense]
MVGKSFMEFKVSSHCDREYLQEEEESNTVEETSKKVEFKANAETAIRNPCGQSRFVCIVRPYCVSNCYLVIIYSKGMKCIICAHCYKQFQRLPSQFARANGLMNKKLGVIIRDERQRSWNLRLATYGLNVHVYNGWDDFCVVNNLKEGDYMTFEVVSDGGKPIWKFRSKCSHLINLCISVNNLFA